MYLSHCQRISIPALDSDQTLALEVAAVLVLHHHYHQNSHLKSLQEFGDGKTCFLYVPAYHYHHMSYL